MGGPNQALNKEDRNSIFVVTFSHKRLSFKNCVDHAHELCTSGSLNNNGARLPLKAS